VPKRIQAHEVDTTGAILYRVVLNEKNRVGDNIVTAPIPINIENPLWDFDKKQWKGGKTNGSKPK
jgi:hypothetical protein